MILCCLSLPSVERGTGVRPEEFHVSMFYRSCYGASAPHPLKQRLAARRAAYEKASIRKELKALTIWSSSRCPIPTLDCGAQYIRTHDTLRLTQCHTDLCHSFVIDALPEKFRWPITPDVSTRVGTAICLLCPRVWKSDVAPTKVAMISFLSEFSIQQCIKAPKP